MGLVGAVMSHNNIEDFIVGVIAVLLYCAGFGGIGLFFYALVRNMLS